MSIITFSFLFSVYSLPQSRETILSERFHSLQGGEQTMEYNNKNKNNNNNQNNDNNKNNKNNKDNNKNNKNNQNEQNR